MSDIIERLRASADEVEEFPHPSHCDHLHSAFKVMREAAAEIAALRKRAEDAEAGLRKANDQAEHFERAWYLAKDAAEQAEADAQRYRWLRDEGEWECFDSAWLIKHDVYGQGPAVLDAAIDAARKETP